MKILACQDLWDSQGVEVAPEFPHLDAFLRQMKTLVDQGKRDHISAFQRLNPASNPFRAVCPTTGQLCAPLRTLITRDKTVFTLYGGAPRFWLALSNLGKGYPPSALYFEDADLLLKFDDPVWGVRETQISELQQALSDSASAHSIEVSEGQNLLVTGDQNFAHVLWNQLPALQALLSDEAFAEAKVAVTHEPLAPLEYLVPGLAPERIIRLSPLMLLHDVNRARAFINTPGSLKIPAETVERVKSVCESFATPEVRAIGERLDADDCPVVWISLREHERTALNQKDLIELLVRRIFEIYDSVNIVLDGFSLPSDISVNYDYSEDFAPTAAKTRMLADAIIEAVQPLISDSPTKAIFNACGLAVADSLYLSSRASFYFCHHGTVQHKVGWIANCYGMVHSNTDILDGKPEQWAASMIENGVAPAYIKRSFIQDVEVSGPSEDDRLQDLRKGNYIFMHLDRLVDDILVHMDLALHRKADSLSSQNIAINGQKPLGADEPQMADLTHSARRLNALAKAFDAKTYLEIGVEKGQTFFDVGVDNKIAVDPNFLFDPKSRENPSSQFFQCTSDAFFGSYYGSAFDLVFLDGLHHFEQTLRDLMNVLVFSHDRTIILIDDVFPTDAFSGLREHGDANFFRAQAGKDGQAWHGDVYKLVYYIHDFLPTLSYATIDDGWNRQTLLWKRPRTEFRPVFNDLEKISRLTYFDIHKHLNVMRFMSEEDVIALAIQEMSSSVPVSQPTESMPSLATRLTRKLSSVLRR